jgi:hypothetical protein
MHWAETAVRLKLQPNVEYPSILPDDLQLSMGTMHEERMVGGELYKPRSRTPLSLDTNQCSDLLAAHCAEFGQQRHQRAGQSSR